MEAISLALILSVGCSVGGSLAAGKDFWVNVLASLALLGPGLLITNVLARNWRTKRETQWIIDQAKGPIAKLCCSLSLPIERALNQLAEILPEGSVDPTYSPKNLTEPLHLSQLQFVHDGLSRVSEVISSSALAEANQHGSSVAQHLLDKRWLPFRNSDLVALREPIAQLRVVLPIHLAELNLQQAEEQIEMLSTSPGSTDDPLAPMKYMIRMMAIMNGVTGFIFEIEQQLQH